MAGVVDGRLVPSDIMPYARAGLGDAADIATAVVKVTQDPYLPEVTCHALRLAALEEGRAPGPACVPTRGAAKGVGIGLRYAVVPVRALVKVREHPYLSSLVALTAMGALFALGYAAAGGRRP